LETSWKRCRLGFYTLSVVHKTCQMPAETLPSSQISPQEELSSPPDEFEQHVRDGLASLYDFSQLQENPVVRQLAPEESGIELVRAARQAFLDAIEQINLTPTGEPRKQSRPHRILLMKYVEEVATRDILTTLSLSERQYYRELGKAITEVSHILWASVRANPGVGQQTGFSVASELDRAYNPAELATVDIRALLSGALEAVSKLASQHLVKIEISPIPALTICSNPPVLRQALILILQRLVTLLPPHSAIAIDVTIEDRAPVLSLTLPRHDNDYGEVLAQFPAFGQLVAMLNMTAHWIENGPQSTLRLGLPANDRQVLIIDDNPMTIDLLNRFLSAWKVSISAASDAARGLALARQMQPRAIILDVMLPGKDGWEVLQSLRTHPDTRHIPVLVCSVLNVSELALSLGANGYLSKPPARADLLTFLRPLLD
jgi:CheY-like chemotaxis protein